jgi:serine/threonine-protein kinase
MSTVRGDVGSPHLIGQRYALVRLLREEPWGGVWLAQDRLLKIDVGLKFCPREAPDFELARDVLLEEAILGFRLRQAQILAAYHAGETAEGAFLVLEPFTGETLLTRLGRLPRYGLPQAMHLLEQIGRGLAAAHSLGLVHQSLNPLNLLVEGERVKVANFTAPPREEDDLSHLELKAYVSPEVLRGQDVTPAANVFSLGVLGFRLTAGSLPYPLTFDEPFPYRLETPPVDLEEIPVPLQNLFLRCLAPQPEDRLSDAEAFLEALGQAREVWRATPREERYAWETPEAGGKGAALSMARRLWEEGKRYGGRLSEDLKPLAAGLKQAPPRLWYGVGLGLVLVLLVWGGSRLLWRAKPGTPPSEPAPAPLRVPEAGTPPSGTPAQPLRPVPGPAPAPAPPQAPSQATSPPPPVAPTGKEEKYIVLLASYTKLEQARALSQKLKTKQLPAGVMKTSPGGKPVYQVRLGPYRSRAAAEEAARKLKSEGYSPKLARVKTAKTQDSPAGRTRR